MKYHFGVPGPIIWLLHILLGLFLLYIGYNIAYGRNINHINGLLVLVIGVLAAVYHAHIWMTHAYKEDES